MRQLSKLQSMLFLAGGALMVIGAGCFAFLFQQQVACWIYLVGAVVFAFLQVSESYDGNNLAIKRLKRIMTFADIMFVLSGLLMVENAHMFLKDAFGDLTTYLNAIYNKWVLALLVAAILEMYTMHRIASEIKKEESATNKDKQTM